MGTGDFNGDGWADFVAANSNSSLSQLHLSDGDGTFAGSNVSGGTAWGQAVALADIDGDGDLDIALGNQASNASVVYLNAPLNPLSLTDTNADGVPDLTPVPVFVSAPSSTNLTATFGEALAGVTSGQLVAHGDQQGEITRSASFSGTGSTTLTANPPANLFPGETVFATLTTAITASSGCGSAVWPRAAVYKRSLGRIARCILSHCRCVGIP